MTSDKVKILADLDSTWGDLKSLAESIPEDLMLLPGVVEEWSLKDLFGHMAFWADKASQDLKALGSGLEGEIETPGSDETVAEWNAREAAARRDESLSELRDEWTRSFDSARSAFEAVPTEKLDVVVKGWPQIQRFLGDTTIHYREHEEHIRTWFKQLETKEG